MPKPSHGQRVARRVSEAVFDAGRHALEMQVAAADAGVRRVGEGGPELAVSIDEHDLVATILCWVVVKGLTHSELNASLRYLGVDVERHSDQIHRVKLPASRAERS